MDVKYGGVEEPDFIRFKSNGVVAQVILAIGGNHGCLSVDGKFTHEVDLFQRADNPHAALRLSAHVAQETLCERFHKVDVCACGAYAEVDVVS